MRSPRLAAGLLATLVVFSACKDSAPPTDGGTAPTLAEAPLGETTVGVGYLFLFSASGSTRPYSFSAQGLPPGFALDSLTGALSGNATAAGDFPLLVSVKGANGQESSKDFILKVYPAVSFKQNPIPAATLLTPYSVTLEAEGGKAPLTLKLISGDLPAGITFNASTGQLSGTAPGSFSIAVLNFEATDVHGARATRSVTLQVAEALRVTTSGLGPATEGVEYRRTDTTSEELYAPFAVGAATFAATGLPQGLSLDTTTGRISGTPEVGSAGAYTLAVTVTDSGSRTVTQSFPLQVVRPSPMTLGGLRGMPPLGGRITHTLTVFTTNGRSPLPGVGVRVRKNGQEYSPPKEALTDADGKAVFTGLDLNGTSDTVDITANGAELINTTLARVNASLVTLRMNANPVFGSRVFGSAAYEPVSRRLIVTAGYDSTNATSLFYTSCHNDVVEPVDLARKQFRTLVPGGLSTSPSPRYDAAMAAADGVAVLFGGRDCIDNGDGLGDTWEFNLATNTWTRASPTTAPAPRRAPALLREPSGSSVLLVGGFRPPSYSNELWRYTPANDTWTLVGTAPFSRAFMGAATNTVTGELWFCGGRVPYTAECQAYNPSTQAWSVKPSLPSARSELSMAFDPGSGNLYAFGGRASDGIPFGDLLVLRAGASSWESVIPQGAAPAPRYGQLLYFDLARGELVLAAGATREPLTLRTTRLSDVWTYDGTAWTERGSPAATAVAYTLSGQITGGPVNGEAVLNLHTLSGVFSQTTVTLDSQGSGTYTLTNIPPGEEAVLTVRGFDPALASPNNLWTYTDADLTPLTAHRTLNLTLPPGPVVLEVSSGAVLLPSSWRGKAVSAFATAMLTDEKFPFVANGSSDDSMMPSRYTVASVRAQLPRSQYLNVYASSEVACEDYGLYTYLPPAPLELTVSGNATGLSPGQAECLPMGPAGVGQARVRIPSTSVERFAVGDIDGDTFPDLVMPRANSLGVGLMWGTPSLHLAFAEEDCCDITQGHSAALGDFDEDGKLDLAVTEPLADQVQIKLRGATTARAFGAATAFPAGTGAASLATADVTEDGNLDLLVANPAANTVSLLPGAGDGTFGAPQPLPLAGTAPRAVLLANVDGDSRPDLVVVVAEGISLSLDGVAQSTFGTPTLLTVGSQPSAVVVGRLNGDTLPDLMVTNEGSNSLSLLLGAGNGTFAAQVNLPTGTAPTGIALAELTGDSHLDVAVTSPVDNTVILYRGASNGTFAEHSRVPVAGTLKSVAAVDLNGDGRNDLAVASQSVNSVYLLPGKRPLPTSAGQSFSFTAPADSGFMQVLHGIHGYRRYWDYYSPIQPGPVSYSLPLPSTLAPSSTPVAPATGQLTLSWTPWVRKWDLRAIRGPFNPRDFYLSNIGSDADTQPGAHLYLWP